MARSKSSVSKMRAATKQWQRDNADKVQAQQRRYYEANRERLVEHARTYRNSSRGKAARAAYSARTKERMSAYKKAYHAANRALIAEKAKAYRQVKARDISARTIATKYGLSIERAQELVDQKRCDLCGAVGRRMHTDHDHATGLVRGRLCGPCNQGLGLLREDVDLLLRAIKYLCDDTRS